MRSGAAFFAFLVLLALAVGLQWNAHAYQADLAGSDETAHFVSGVLAWDYLTQIPWTNPMQFARNFYHHYPRVAIGHWPPVFYFVQAAWYGIAQVSRPSVLGLQAVLAALTGAVLFEAWRSRLGNVTAFLLSLLWLGLPLTRVLSAMVMAEVLLTLFMSLAVLQCCRLIDRVRTIDGVLFGLAASLAILTKPNGLALAFVPPLMIVATRRWSLLRSRSLWLSAGIVVVLCLPWYLATYRMAAEGWRGSASVTWIAKSVASFNAQVLAEIFGIPALLLAAVGACVALRRSVDTQWAAAISITVGLYLFHTFVTPVREDRHFLYAIPWVLPLAVAGLRAVVDPLRVASQWKAVAAGCGVFLLVGFHAWQPWTKKVYGAIPAATWLHQISGPSQSVLVSSMNMGEGALIAELALLEPRPRHRIVRATQFLVSTDWGGWEYKLRYDNPTDILASLRKEGISFIAVDHTPTIPGTASRHHQEIEHLIASNPASFSRVIAAGPNSGSFDVWRFNGS